MASLRARLEALADTRPTEEDPDAEGGDDDNTLTRRLAANKASRGGAGEHRPSKLRAAAANFVADLEHHPKYAGRVVSVSKSKSAADDFDNEEEEEEDEADDDDVGTDDEEDDDEEEEESGDGVMDDASEEGEDGDDDDDVGEAYDAPRRARPTGDADADAEAELRALSTADGVALSRYRARQQEDSARGSHVKGQAELAEASMEARIKMQKALTAANALPGPKAHAVLAAQGPGVAAAFASARSELVALLAQMLRLRAALLSRVPEAAKGVVEARGLPPQADAADVERALLPALCPRAGSKRRRVEEDEESVDAGDEEGGQGEEEGGGGPAAVAPLDLTSADLWECIQGGWDATAAWRDGTIDTWARRSAYASGLPSQGGSRLRVLGGDLTASVRAMLVDDRERLRARSHLPHGAVRHMGEAAQDAAAAPPAPDLETYDDGELYAALLKDYVSAASARQQARDGAIASAAAVAGGKAGYKHSRRDGVDRKASKGRKLRYVVHPKLVAFAAPTPFQVPPELAYDVDLLVASLFRG